MARSYARILTNVWDNADFVATTPGAKLLFFHLCSRRDLSSAGHLVMRDRLWAQQVFNSDMEMFWDAMSELSDLRYVVIDDTTGELLIRTFIRHDGGFRNSKMRSAMRSAMGEMESTMLRDIAHASLIECTTEPPSDPPQDEPSDALSDHPSDALSQEASDGVPDPTCILITASCNQNTRAPAKRKAKPRAGPDHRFDEFWEAYPRHEAEARARPAFIKALKETDLPTMLVAITAQRLSERETTFVPLAASWLNGKRWNDEVNVRSIGTARDPRNRDTPRERPDGILMSGHYHG